MNIHTRDGIVVTVTADTADLGRSIRIIIDAPDLVRLESAQFQLQRNRIGRTRGADLLSSAVFDGFAPFSLSFGRQTFASIAENSCLPFIARPYCVFNGRVLRVIACKNGCLCRHRDNISVCEHIAPGPRVRFAIRLPL